MSVTTVLQSALYRFGQTEDNARFKDDFYQAINDAQNDFCNLRSWGFLRTTTTLTTVDGTNTVALPTDFATPYNINGGMVISTSGYSGNIVELMPYEHWLVEHWEDGTEEGEPTYAYILGDYVYLSPTPDDEYTISFPYYKKPTTIDDSSDSITIPERYQETLRKMIWRRLQDCGYASVTEMQISDADIQRLVANCAKDDIKRYGGMTFNLPGSSFTRSTI